MEIKNNQKGSVIFGLVLGVLLVSGIFIYSGMRSEDDFPQEEENQIVLSEETQTKDMTEEENKNITTTPDGLVMEILQEGDGALAENGKKVTVHYTGTFESGEKFDSSVDRGTPFTFTLGAGQVIKGWDEGVLGMKIGEKRKLTIPYTLGYGADGYGPIPPKATLIFEVELLNVI